MSTWPSQSIGATTSRWSGGLNSTSSLWVPLILPCRTPVTLFSAFLLAKGRYPTIQGEKWVDTQTYTQVQKHEPWHIKKIHAMYTHVHVQAHIYPYMDIASTSTSPMSEAVCTECAGRSTHGLTYIQAQVGMCTHLSMHVASLSCTSHRHTQAPGGSLWAETWSFEEQRETGIPVSHPPPPKRPFTTLRKKITHAKHFRSLRSQQKTEDPMAMS